jgi:CheY-like chemotaxis protein
MAKTILVVDNDADYVAATEAVLKARGYETLSALDADSALELAATHKPDAILLDVMMRHVSEGLDVARWLHDDPDTRGIPVILVTGIRKPDFLMSSYSGGQACENVKGTLEKPVKPETLLDMISKVVA